MSRRSSACCVWRDMRLRTWIGSLRRRRELDVEFDDEIQFHLEQRIAEYRASGMADHDARRAARARFGSEASAKRGMRRARLPIELVWQASSLVVVVALAGTLIWHGAADRRVYEVGGDVNAPVPLVVQKPRYTQAAMVAKIQGTVTVRCVIATSGVCADPTVERSLDSRLGLDDEAIRAMRAWRFRPATRDGAAVAARVRIDLSFALRQ